MNKYSEYEVLYRRFSVKLNIVTDRLIIKKLLGQKERTKDSFNNIIREALYRYYGYTRYDV